MAKKTPQAKRGQLVVETHVSKVLADNPLGDPAERPVHLYLPHHYHNKRNSKRRFPVLFDLVGYTGAGPAHTNWKNFEENVPERLDRLIAEGKMAPCIVVFPDCFTALGGNQYINSSAIGRYADYLTKELIPFVDSTTRSLASREHRGCFGKSSGGYGAMVHGMKYAKYWGAIANHSGDAYFDFVYKAEWPRVLTALQKYATGKIRASQQKAGFDDGRVENFLTECWQKNQLTGQDITVLMMLCMAATYDPDPKAPNGFRLPYDLHTGELLQRRWQAWLKHDPIHMVRKHRDNLKSLKGIFIDCGWRDQYHIHFGTRLLSRALGSSGIKHRYEEFDGSHSGIDHRMDVSLPFLARTLR